MDERKAAVQMLKKLNCGPYIVTMDRGYSSFNMIENCNRLLNCFYIIRTKAGHGAVKEIAALPNQECDKDIACWVTTSNYYYETHKATEAMDWGQMLLRMYQRYCDTAGFKFEIKALWLSYLPDKSRSNS